MKEHISPPQNIDAEQQVLGSILTDPEAMDAVIQVVSSPDYFFADRHKTIFRAMLSLYQRGLPIDITMTAEELSKVDALGSVGGRIYLVDLVGGIVTTTNVKEHAEIVAEKYRLRQTAANIEKIFRECYEPGTTVSDIASSIQSIIDTATDRQKQHLFTARDKLPQLLEQLDYINRGIIQPGLNSHIEDLNEFFRFRPGYLVVIGARTGEGKTALLLNIAEFIAYHQDQRVLFFSLEMTSDEIFLRQLLSMSKVPSNRFLSKIRISDRAMGDITKVAGIMETIGDRLIVCDQGGINPTEIKSIARQEHKKKKLGLIAIDYLTMVSPDKKTYGNREQEVASIIRSFKLLAKELMVPVVVCAQLNREIDKQSKKRKPKPSDLRESGAIEQDADVIILIYHPSGEVGRTAKLIIAKNRHGQKGEIDVAWIPEYVRFEGIDKHHTNDN